MRAVKEEKDKMIFNALDKEVKVAAFGNQFTFKPYQMKRMRGDIGSFLEVQKGYQGIVAIDDAFEDPEYAKSEVGAAALEEKKKEGVAKRIQHLEMQINNLRISLRQDLDKVNIKADVNAFATKGDLAAMDELLSYQRLQLDASKERAEHARVAMRRLDSAQNALVNKKAD